MSIASMQTLMLKLVLNSRDTKASKSAIFWRSLRGKPMSRDEFYAPGQAPACEMRGMVMSLVRLPLNDYFNSCHDKRGESIAASR